MDQHEARETIAPGDTVLQVREVGIGQRRPGELLVLAVDSEGLVLSPGPKDQPITDGQGLPRHFPVQCFCKSKKH